MGARNLRASSEGQTGPANKNTPALLLQRPAAYEASSVYREFGCCLCANKDNEFISFVCVGNGVGFAFLQPDFWRPPTRPGQNRKQVHMDGVALSLTHTHTCFLFCPQDRTDPYTHSTMGLPFLHGEEVLNLLPLDQMGNPSKCPG